MRRLSLLPTGISFFRFFLLVRRFAVNVSNSKKRIEKKTFSAAQFFLSFWSFLSTDAQSQTDREKGTEKRAQN